MNSGTRVFSWFRHHKWASTGAAIFGAGITGTYLRSALFMTPSTPVESTEEWLGKRFKVELRPQSLVDKVKLTRKISTDADTSGLDLRLYQYQSCPFCAKVRAFLDYYGFSYEVVEVDPVTRAQIKFSKYRKVPIVVAQGQENRQLNDSTFIVSLLKTYLLNPSQSVDEILDQYPHHLSEDGKKVEIQNKYFVLFHDKVKTKEEIAITQEEREWREWVDSVFIHTISPNVYQTWSEALETFYWFAESGDYRYQFGAIGRLMAIYVGATAMYYIAKRLKKKHAIKPDPRESLYDACGEWIHAMGRHRKFMGGDRPNLADLAFYGAINSFLGCRAFDDMMQNTKIGPWFNAVREAVDNRWGSEELQTNLQIAHLSGITPK